jgi:hypothetical protein
MSKERDPYPLRRMIPLTVVTAVIAGTAGGVLVVANLLKRLRGRPEQDVPDGEPPVSTLFRSMDERRDT